MTIAALLEQLETSAHPVAKAIHSGHNFKVLALAFKKGMTLKEHKAHLPSKLTVLYGAVIYRESDKEVLLSQYGMTDIPIDVVHSVEATEDSLCLLTQGSDSLINKPVILEDNFHYATVSSAINTLRKQGFVHDFNMEANHLVCDADKFAAEDFEIVDIYRYEGNSDPADEAVVYALESKSGKKGVLVTGYGISSDSVSPELLAKLHKRE